MAVAAARPRPAGAADPAPAHRVRRTALQYGQPHGRGWLRLPVDRHQRWPGPVRRPQLPGLARRGRTARQPCVERARGRPQPAVDRHRERGVGDDVGRSARTALLRPGQPSGDRQQHHLEHHLHRRWRGLVRYLRGRPASAGSRRQGHPLHARARQPAQPAGRVGDPVGHHPRRQPVGGHQGRVGALDRARFRTHRGPGQGDHQRTYRRAGWQPLDRHQWRRQGAAPGRAHRVGALGGRGRRPGAGHDAARRAGRVLAGYPLRAGPGVRQPVPAGAAVQRGGARPGAAELDRCLRGPRRRYLAGQHQWRAVAPAAALVAVLGVVAAGGRPGLAAQCLRAGHGRGRRRRGVDGGHARSAGQVRPGYRRGHPVPHLGGRYPVAAVGAGGWAGARVDRVQRCIAALRPQGRRAAPLGPRRGGGCGDGRPDRVAGAVRRRPGLERLVHRAAATRSGRSRAAPDRGRACRPGHRPARAGPDLRQPGPPVGGDQPGPAAVGAEPFAVRAGARCAARADPCVGHGRR
ncbi:hypothetical protein D3C71_847720 [compost metagenome]